MQTPGTGQVRGKENVSKERKEGRHEKLEKKVRALYEETVREPVPDELLEFLSAAGRRH